MPRTATTAAATTNADAAPPLDSAAALQSAMSALRERVAMVDQIVASSPAVEPSVGIQPPASPAMHTPLGSPAQTPMATPMEAPAVEQDSRIQTTVLSDVEIEEMVAQGTTASPQAPSSAQKLRGLGARLAGSLVSLNPVRAGAVTVDTDRGAVSEEKSPTELMRLENCRERGLPDTATWNDIADHDMALSPQDIEERRKDTVGRLLQLATAGPKLSPQNTSDVAEQIRPEIQRASCEQRSAAKECELQEQAGVWNQSTQKEEAEPYGTEQCENAFLTKVDQDVSEPELSEQAEAQEQNESRQHSVPKEHPRPQDAEEREIILSPNPNQDASEPELSQLLDGFQVLALATPAALPSASIVDIRVSTPEAQGTPGFGSPSCGGTRSSSDSFGSAQSGSILNDSCSPVGAEPVRRAGAGRRRGGSIDAALAMLPGTPQDYDIAHDSDEHDAMEEEVQVDQAQGIPEDSDDRRAQLESMDISLHSFIAVDHEKQHDAPHHEVAPRNVEAQCVLNGDSVGAKLALASVFSSSDKAESAGSSYEADSSAVALEDSFAMAEAEARQQVEDSFAVTQKQLQEGFIDAEAEIATSPGDAVCSAFGDDFGQLLAEARRLVGTSQKAVSPVLAPHSPQQLDSPHTHVDATHDACVPKHDMPSLSSDPNVANATNDEPTVEANAAADELTLRIGQRCEVVLQGKCQRGEICFLGSAPLLGIGEWAGVKLDSPCGKHDGSVQGKRYFKCQSRCGVLLKQERVKPSLECPHVAKGPVTRSQTAAMAAIATAKVASTAPNRFMQRATEQVHAAATDPTSPLHGTDVDFSELVAEARQLAGEVEISDLRRSTMNSPAATPSQQRRKEIRATRTGRRSSVDAVASVAAAAEPVPMPTPEHAAEAEAELYLLKRKLRVLWKDMGRQSLRRVLKRSCPSGKVQFDDFLQSLRIGGHINAKLLSDLELRRLFRSAKLESCAPGTTVSSHDITPLPVDTLVSFLGLESTHAEPKKNVADAADTKVDANVKEDEFDFKALLREAREVIGTIPVVRSPPTATATVATAAVTADRSGKPRATATASAVYRMTSHGTDEPTPASAPVDHSTSKRKQPRRPLSAPKQRYAESATKQPRRASPTARASRTRSKTPDTRGRPASSLRAASNSRGRRALSASCRPRPSTAPTPTREDATQMMMADERDLDASPKELSYAERALADAQRRQAWRAKQQEVQEERARTAASGRPGGKPVRKRTPAAQARFLEQMDQNDQARKQRLLELRKEASQEVQAKVLRCAMFVVPVYTELFPSASTVRISKHCILDVDSFGVFREKPAIPKSSKKILAESSNGQRRRPSGNFVSRSDQLLKEKREREHAVSTMQTVEM